MEYHIVYHYTCTRNVPKILKQGLFPDVHHPSKLSCLARSPSSWLLWASRCVVPVSILQLNVEGIDLVPTLSPAEYLDGSAHGYGDELRCWQHIPPQRIVSVKPIPTLHHTRLKNSAKEEENFNEQT